MLYRISVGVVLGAGIGWLLGRALFVVPRGKLFAQSGSGVIALAAVLLCYGLVELTEGYGFHRRFRGRVDLPARLRRAEKRHDFHRRLHTFSKAIEHAVTAVLLFLLFGVRGVGSVYYLGYASGHVELVTRTSFGRPPDPS